MLFHEHDCPKHMCLNRIEAKRDVTAAQTLTIAIYILAKETPTTPWLSKVQMRGNAKTPKTLHYVASSLLAEGKEKKG